MCYDVMEHEFLETVNALHVHCAQIKLQNIICEHSCFEYC